MNQHPSIARSACVMLCAVALLCGCQDHLARRVVKAPNLKSPLRGVDAPQDVLDSMYVNRQIRIPVGPPDATLSVWVCEPFHGGGSFAFKQEGMKFVGQITRRPATAPSAQETKGTILLLHGIEDSKDSAPYLLYREMLVHAGYRCVQVDLRGHGRSTGDWISYGVFESHDLVQVLDELDRRGLIIGNVGVMGLSYGASIAIQWAAIDRRVRAVVAMEPFCRLDDAAIDASRLVLWGSRWMYSDDDIRAAVRAGGRLAGFDSEQASPLAVMQHLTTPVLLFHSNADELVPVRHSQRLHDANPEYSRLVLVDHQSHFALWWESREMIRELSVKWLHRHVAGLSPTSQPAVDKASARLYGGS